RSGYRLLATPSEVGLSPTRRRGSFAPLTVAYRRRPPRSGYRRHVVGARSLRSPSPIGDALLVFRLGRRLDQTGPRTRQRLALGVRRVRQVCVVGELVDGAGFQKRAADLLGDDGVQLGVVRGIAPRGGI